MLGHNGNGTMHHSQCHGTHCMFFIGKKFQVWLNPQVIFSPSIQGGMLHNSEEEKQQYFKTYWNTVCREGYRELDLRWETDTCLKLWFKEVNGVHSREHTERSVDNAGQKAHLDRGFTRFSSK